MRGPLIEARWNIYRCSRGVQRVDELVERGGQRPDRVSARFGATSLRLASTAVVARSSALESEAGNLSVSAYRSLCAMIFGLFALVF